MAARRLASSGELTTLVGPLAVVRVIEAKSANVTATTNDFVFIREAFRWKTNDWFQCRQAGQSSLKLPECFL
jgi:hypothetical protein